MTDSESKRKVISKWEGVLFDSARKGWPNLTKQKFCAIAHKLVVKHVATERYGSAKMSEDIVAELTATYGNPTPQKQTTKPVRVREEHPSRRIH